MKEPKNVLLVTNSATDDEIIHISNAIKEFKEKGLNIQLNLVHVIPTLPTCYFNIPSMALLAERYYDEAKQSLNYIGERLMVSANNQWIMTGKMRQEVLRLANKLHIHFILASTETVQDFHKSFLFRSDADNMPIQSISRAALALNE